MIHRLLFFFLFIASATAFSQTNNLKLNIEEVLAIVKTFHPIVKQAKINIEKSKADVTIARGSFNPIIANYLGNKTIANTNYYNLINPSITIPTWFGIEVSAGVQDYSGDRLDNSMTNGKQNYVGIQVPLLKNLLIDKRRASLKQAIIFKDLRNTQQQIVVNDILMDASVQYWEWVNAFESYEIIRKNVAVSKQRFELVEKTFLNGERPAIDTIEAKIQYQSFELLENEYFLKFKNEGLLLSSFLWKENNIPYLLPENILPFDGWKNKINNQTIELDDLLQKAKQFHPELEFYKQKISGLEIEKKLKFQELLPKLDFEYNHFNKNYNLETNGLLFQNNYQYGLKLEMPLFLSNGRGEYKNARLKIEETLLSQSEKTLAIEIKIKNYYNEFLTLKKQLQLQQDVLGNYEKLLKAEETLFMNGESSLFLINARETKLLESKQKLVNLKTKYFKTIYALQWSAGILK